MRYMKFLFTTSESMFFISVLKIVIWRDALPPGFNICKGYTAGYV